MNWTDKIIEFAVTFKNDTENSETKKVKQIQSYQSIQITQQAPYQVSNPSLSAWTKQKFKKQILVINGSPKHEIQEWQQAAFYLYTAYTVQSNFNVHMQHLHFKWPLSTLSQADQ